MFTIIVIRDNTDYTPSYGSFKTEEAAQTAKDKKLKRKLIKFCIKHFDDFKPDYR